MKKWMYIGGALILIVVAALVIGLSKLGPIIKTAVNTYGPKITKTEVRVKDVSISLFAGEAKLKDFLSRQPQRIQLTSGHECKGYICGCG